MSFSMWISHLFDKINTRYRYCMLSNFGSKSLSLDHNNDFVRILSLNKLQFIVVSTSFSRIEIIYKLQFSLLWPLSLLWRFVFSIAILSPHLVYQDGGHRILYRVRSIYT